MDFVLVDGDHSADGARSDVADLLASDVVANTVILAHDSLNQEVRRGLDAVPYEEIEKVAFVDLDFVGGYVPAESPTKGECWGGLALIVVDESGAFGPAHDGATAADGAALRLRLARDGRPGRRGRLPQPRSRDGGLPLLARDRPAAGRERPPPRPALSLPRVLRRPACAG